MNKLTCFSPAVRAGNIRLLFFILGMLSVPKSGLFGQSPVTYSTPGTYTFTVPACVTSITVQCWGAGGGGGGADEGGSGAAAAGGGGGGYATATLTNLSATYTVVVGSGGGGGNTSGSNGTSGGSSTVTNGTVTVTGVGGGGGEGETSSGVATPGGTGGGGTFVGVTGTFYKGGNGGLGNNQDYNDGGGGGGGAGSSGNGATPATPGENANAVGGAGGTGNASGSGGSVTADWYENGGNGNFIGGGGGGAGGENATFHPTGAGTGGNGANGEVIITYTTSLPTITSVTGSGCPGSTVTINGTLLTGATSVKIGTTAVTNLSITSTVITGTIAAGTTTGTVSVTTSCGHGSSSSPFTVYQAPAPVNLGTVSICGGTGYTFGGHTYTSAGTYTDTATSTLTGCDSFTTVTLVGGAVIQKSISQSVCGGGSYSFGGHTYTQSGTYLDTATSTVTGCDSITTLTLTITPLLYSATSQSVCAGSGYSFNGTTYTIPGTYADTLIGAGANGCDSIAALILSVNPAATSTTNGAICNGAGYTFNGVTYTTPGTYADTLTGAGSFGCDSIATLVLTLKSTSADSVIATAPTPVFCSGDSVQICATQGFASYNWGSGINTACFYTSNVGSYEVTVTDTSGCTATSNQVSVSTFLPTPVTISVNGDTLTSNGAVAYQWFLNWQAIAGDTGNLIVATQSGNYTVQITDIHGCHYTSAAAPVTTAINNLRDAPGVVVYPNPLNTGNWHLSVGEDMIGSWYDVLDANGRSIFKSPITSQYSEIVLDAAKGVYIMQIHTAQSNYNLKLIKLN